MFRRVFRTSDSTFFHIMRSVTDRPSSYKYTLSRASSLRGSGTWYSSSGSL